MRAYLEWHELSGSSGLPEESAVEPTSGGEGANPELGEPAPPFGPPPAEARSAEALALDPRLDPRLDPPLGPPLDPPLGSPSEPPAHPAGARAPRPDGASGRAPPPSSEARLARLEVLAEEVRGCQRCALAGTRTQTVFSRGNPQAELAFVGEGPGADEDAQGLPFVGKAGQLLDRMIVAMGMRPEEVYVANVVKCRPPNNRKPEPSEMASCLPYLTEQLGLVGPKVIVALGATAVQGLFGTTEGITRVRGQWRLYKGAIPVMPTFHPAYLLRNPAAKREVWTDLKEVLRTLGKPVPSR